MLESEWPDLHALENILWHLITLTSTNGARKKSFQGKALVLLRSAEVTTIHRLLFPIPPQTPVESQSYLVLGDSGALWASRAVLSQPGPTECGENLCLAQLLLLHGPGILRWIIFNFFSEKKQGLCIMFIDTGMPRGFHWKVETCNNEESLSWRNSKMNNKKDQKKAVLGAYTSCWYLALAAEPWPLTIQGQQLSLKKNWEHCGGRGQLPFPG